MFRTVISLAAAALLFGTVAHAQTPAKIDLLTENFPPYNMADDGKNFARDEHITALPPTACARCSSVTASSTR